MAVNKAARLCGLQAGQSMRDARAIFPGLMLRQAEPEADARALKALAKWCVHYTPWTTVDGADGLWLDITGCAHLFGGEACLLKDLVARLSNIGITARPGLAETPGAAFAIARFAPSIEIHKRIIETGSITQALAALPAEALRLEDDTVILLQRLGLRTIGDLMELPRAPLEKRFRAIKMSPSVLHKLDQALGRVGEPLSPLVPIAPYRACLNLAEPILTQDAVEYGLEDLLLRLCRDLGRHQQGARRLTLYAYRSDGGVSQITIAASRPSRDIKHFQRLFADRLERIDPGWGIDVLILTADGTARIAAHQDSLIQTEKDASQEKLGRLVDRLSNRLGAENIRYAEARQSHIPERAESWVPALSTTRGDSQRREDAPMRPSRLLARPEPIQVLAEVPEGPPAQFTWRRMPHRIIRAEGPERIAPEWWLEEGADYSRIRDYYRVEDNEGRRFWLFREGLYQLIEPPGAPRWFMHGLFA